MTPDGAKLYRAIEFAGLKKIEVSTKTVSTVSTVVCPAGVTVTPNGRFLYMN
jgi:hypothetical protein